MRISYPWKLGATSFVIPASVVENVKYLAGLVDDIQLLFFESSWQARLPHKIDTVILAELAKEYGHSYTVHLPLDLQLGCIDSVTRNQSIDEICRIVDVCDVLDPQAYDLHLHREKDLPDDEWCSFCQDSLFLLRDRLGSRWERVCIENIEYDFDVLADVILSVKAKVCVDFGHLHHQGFTDENYFAAYNIGHVHLHGVSGGCDHQTLCDVDLPFIQRLGQEMVHHGYSNIVTLELYKSESWRMSLIILKRAWADFIVT